MNLRRNRSEANTGNGACVLHNHMAEGRESLGQLTHRGNSALMGSRVWPKCCGICYRQVLKPKGTCTEKNRPESEILTLLSQYLVEQGDRKSVRAEQKRFEQHLNQLDPVDIYRTLHPTTELIFFSSVYGTFDKTDHTRTIKPVSMSLKVFK